MTRRALVVCAHERTGNRLAAVVRAAGMEPMASADGESALYLSTEHLFDVVVITPDLPGMEAEELCRELRRRGRTAIVVVSAAGQRRRISALAAGADDHVALPFHGEELAARLRAVVRRTAGSLAAERTVWAGPVAVRVAHGSATIEGAGDRLGSEEATVLGALAERPGCVVASAALRDRLAARHGREAADRVEELVGGVSAALESAGAPAVCVVRGVGYLLRP